MCNGVAIAHVRLTVPKPGYEGTYRESGNDDGEKVHDYSIPNETTAPSKSTLSEKRERKPVWEKAVITRDLSVKVPAVDEYKREGGKCKANDKNQPKTEHSLIVYFGGTRGLALKNCSAEGRLRDDNWTPRKNKGGTVPFCRPI